VCGRASPFQELNLSLADILQDGKSVKGSGVAITPMGSKAIEIVLKTGGPPLTQVAPMPTPTPSRGVLQQQRGPRAQQC
jgi:hypothetical protein